MKKFILRAMLLIMESFGYGEISITHMDHQCSQAENSTVSIVYQANVRNLLDSFVTNAPLQDGFFNTSLGDGSDQVYGLAWCRWGVSPRKCSECLNESINISLTDCLTIWNSFCNLRFSNENFFGKWNKDSSVTYGSNGLDNPLVFSQGFSMMENLARNASNQPLKFGMDVIGVGGNGERYGLGQCSRDLNQSDCENCLKYLLMTNKTYVLNRTGWVMLSAGCGMWYDDVLIYDDPGLVAAPKTSGGGEIWHKAEGILASVAFLVFCLIQ